MYERNTLNAFLKDSTIYKFSSRWICSTLCVRPPAAGGGALRAPERPPDKRVEQREDAPDGEEGAQPLPRDGLRGLTGRPGQRDARELVYEARPHGGAYDREDYGDDEGQERHEEPVLDAGGARHPAGDVAADVEGYEERQEQADEPGYAAARGAVSDAEGREDAAHYHADYAAQDQAGAKRGEPAQHDADPARPELGLAPLALGRALLAHVPGPARRGLLSICHLRSPPRLVTSCLKRFFTPFVGCGSRLPGRFSHRLFTAGAGFAAGAPRFAPPLPSGPKG